MKKQIRAIAAVAAATMLLTGCAAHQQNNASEQTPTTQTQSSTACLLVQRRHRQWKTGRCLTIFRSGQTVQLLQQLQLTRVVAFLLEKIHSMMMTGQRAFLWTEHLTSTV